MYRNIFKYLLDLLLASMILIITAPVITLITLILLIVFKGKPFFIQPRPGKDERIFHIIKFRTMNEKRDFEGNLLPDNARLTHVGRFLRKTSLDELPQLFNIIKGDMSLVGPRPLLPEYVPLYNDFQRRRHEVKPGITGWAQVNGRNAISWDQKFEYDVWYVDHVSFKLDLRILFLTVLKVLKGSGINSSENMTMEKFKG